jgi:hypothetical protein
VLYSVHGGDVKLTHEVLFWHVDDDGWWRMVKIEYVGQKKSNGATLGFHIYFLVVTSRFLQRHPLK